MLVKWGVCTEPRGYWKPAPTHLSHHSHSLFTLLPPAEQYGSICCRQGRTGIIIQAGNLTSVQAKKIKSRVLKNNHVYSFPTVSQLHFHSYSCIFHFFCFYVLLECLFCTWDFLLSSDWTGMYHHDALVAESFTWQKSVGGILLYFPRYFKAYASSASLAWIRSESTQPRQLYYDLLRGGPPTVWFSNFLHTNQVVCLWAYLWFCSIYRHFPSRLLSFWCTPTQRFFVSFFRSCMRPIVCDHKRRPCHQFKVGGGLTANRSVGL